MSFFSLFFKLRNLIFLREERLMPVESDTLSKNARGGTELMKLRMMQEVADELLEPFQIFVSRIETPLDPAKIRVLWSHDLPQDPACDPLRNGGWSQFDAFVFNSSWQMQCFHEHIGIPYSRSVVLQNAIDPIQTIQKTSKKIRMVYHPTPHRGLSILVPVFEKLCQLYDDIELDIFSSFELYGWSERDIPYQELFQRCKEHPRIHYHGSVSNTQVKEALASAHIFAYPCIWTETSCIALIEAMSAGLICVHPNLGALFDTSGGLTRMYQWQEKKIIERDKRIKGK
ncbi:MAG: glycosyltransferase [Chlamydiae bacterium]|nr:glycosyltransferase [Chlamydiota bacterium]